MVPSPGRSPWACSAATRAASGADVGGDPRAVDLRGGRHPRAGQERSETERAGRTSSPPTCGRHNDNAHAQQFASQASMSRGCVAFRVRKRASHGVTIGSHSPLSTRARAPVGYGCVMSNAVQKQDKGTREYQRTWAECSRSTTPSASWRFSPARAAPASVRSLRRSGCTSRPPSASSPHSRSATWSSRTPSEGSTSSGSACCAWPARSPAASTWSDSRSRSSTNWPANRRDDQLAVVREHYAVHVQQAIGTAAVARTGSVSSLRCTQRRGEDLLGHMSEERNDDRRAGLTADSNRPSPRARR